MTDKTFDNLPPAASVDVDASVPIQQGGVTYKATPAQVATAGAPMLDIAFTGTFTNPQPFQFTHIQFADQAEPEAGTWITAWPDMVGGGFAPDATLETLTVGGLAGIAASASIGYFDALTALSFPDLTRVTGTLNIGPLAVVADLDLGALEETSRSLDISGLPELPALVLTSFRQASGFNLIDNASLISASLPALENLGTGQFSIDCAALTTFSINSGVKRLGADITVIAPLNQASVDSLLVRLAALDGSGGTTSYDNQTVIIGGLSAAPGVSGAAAVVILQSRGCTVTTN